MNDLLLPAMLLFVAPDVTVYDQHTTISIFPVEPAAVTQYWGTRCQESVTITELPDTVALFPGLPIVDVYLAFEQEIYFVDQLPVDAVPRSYFENLQLFYHREPAAWAPVYYIVAPDETNPGAGRLNLEAGTLEVRTGCAVHLPILAPFKEQRRLSVRNR